MTQSLDLIYGVIQTNKDLSVPAPLPVSPCCCAAPPKYVRRSVWVAGGGNDNGLNAGGHGFSALNTGLQPPSGPLIATAEVHPEPPSAALFPDPITWELPPEATAAAGTASAAEEEDPPAAAAAGGVLEAAAPAPGAGSTDQAGGRRLVRAETPPSVAGGGYQTGKWLWEWQIVSCGNRASVGVCGHDVATISAAGVPVQGAGEGDRADLWLYRSDGNLSHGGESTDRACPGGGFDSGDVIGVELDADAGTLTFLKNDSYVGAQFDLVRRSDAAAATAKGDGGSGDASGDASGGGSGGGGGRGLYPCVSLRGSGDAAVLLGLKKGSATITYRPPSSDKKAGGSGRSSPSPPPPPPLPAGDAAMLALSAAAEAVAAAAATVGGGGDAAAPAAVAAEASPAASEQGTAAAAAAGSSTEQPASPSPGGVEAAAAAGAAAAADSSQDTASSAAAETAADSAASAGGSSSGAAADGGAVEGAAATRSVGTDAAAAAPVVPVPPPPPPPLSPPQAAVSTPLPSPSFHPAYFHGEFVRGLKHGTGVLRLSGKGGYWRGKWFQGVQHGVHLMVEAPAKKGQNEEDGTPAAWVFDRGVKACLCVCVLELCVRSPEDN